MGLYTVQVPNPPAGQDFSTMVPGLYLWDVTGITAQLSTGNDEPLVGATVAIPTNVADWDTNWTIAVWLAFDPSFDGAGFVLYAATGGGLGHVLTIFGNVGNGTTSLFCVHGFPGFDWSWGPNLFQADNTVYFVVLRFDGTTVTLRINGVAVAAAGPGSPGTFGGNTVYSIGEPGGGTANVVDEFSTWKTDLTDAQCDALYAAGLDDFAAYSAAVLALSPYVYYHLDEGSGTTAVDASGNGYNGTYEVVDGTLTWVPGLVAGDLAWLSGTIPVASTGRTPALYVSDGTHIVELIGDGFAATSSPGPYGYSWLPNLSTNTQTPGGGLTTVGISPLIIPAGYVVGTLTPDIEPTDQWSDITLWWDPSYMNAVDPLNGYQFPGGIRLTYQQETVSP